MPKFNLVRLVLVISNRLIKIHFSGIPNAHRYACNKSTAVCNMLRDGTTRCFKRRRDAENIRDVSKRNGYRLLLRGHRALSLRVKKL